MGWDGRHLHCDCILIPIGDIMALPDTSDYRKRATLLWRIDDIDRMIRDHLEGIQKLRATRKKVCNAFRILDEKLLEEKKM